MRDTVDKHRQGDCNKDDNDKNYKYVDYGAHLRPGWVSRLGVSGPGLGLS